MWNCINCGKPIPDSEEFCVSCNLPKPKYQKNYCTNPMCERFMVELEDPQQPRCGKCGKLTTVGKEINKFN